MNLCFINWNVDPIICQFNIPLYINVMFFVYLIGLYLLFSKKKTNVEKKIKRTLTDSEKSIKEKLDKKYYDPWYRETPEDSNYRWLIWMVLSVLLFSRLAQYFIYNNITGGDILIPINFTPRIFFFSLHWYSFGFLFAFVIGYITMSAMLKKEYVAQERLEHLLIYLFLAVLVGARLGHCLFYEPEVYFSNAINIGTIILPIDTNGQFVGFQGLASHGAAIGILIAIWLYSQKFKVNGWWLLDRLVIIVALAGTFIRLGNLFNSEIYGVETSLPWGFVFELRGETVPKHPTQLYESLSYLIIFIVCLSVYRKKDGKLHNGRLFGYWLIALFGMRFLIEFVKEEQVAFEQGMTLDMGQWLSVPFILGGVILIILSHKGVLKDGIFVEKKD